jgi:integrase
LRWSWEIKVSQLDTFVFRIPEDIAKNGRARFIILNDVAIRIVNEQRGKDDDFVFVYEGHPVQRMLNSAWCRARKKVGLPMVRVHDLRHTAAARLRAAGVTHEDRAQILGHVTNTMTTHYSAAYLQQLLDAVNRICESRGTETDPIILR